MVIIRKALPSDLNCLVRIFTLNIPKYFHEKELLDFKKHFNSNNIETYFIIESEGKIFGASGYAYENKQTARVCWVFVDPNHHSNGLGKKLVNHCVDILKRDNQLNVIELETSNLTYKFYEKLNFKIQYIKKKYWPNNDDLYFMNMHLNYSNIQL
jgi:ribosomal protein S18 acetylase RimI-like enzyme|tara:strand:- start:715 stop:1179 length:465 start_codon:yes stop_codon:yes gene_type:complete